jgi:hypothetical protein
MIRIVLPYHLRTLAQIETDELPLDLPADPVPTLNLVLTALETRHPVLRGLIRDHSTLQRRPFIRFYACREDLTHASPDTPLPTDILTGAEPLLIVGAMAGG